MHVKYEQNFLTLTDLNLLPIRNVFFWINLIYFLKIDAKSTHVTGLRHALAVAGRSFCFYSLGIQRGFYCI